MDDEPGQKDVTELCVYEGESEFELTVTFNFDDTQWPGANTGNSCILFDSDFDTFANYALCVTVENGPPATQASFSPRFFQCNDDRYDRCSGAIEIETFASVCYVNTGGSEPSGEDADPFAGEPRGNNVCTGTSCLTVDTFVKCLIAIDDIVYGEHCENGNCVVSGAICGIDSDCVPISDSCAVVSEEPNSDPSDCVTTSTEQNPCQGVDCTYLNDACNVGVCSTRTGQCVSTPRADGYSCDDGLYCNGTDTCSGGTCSVHSGDPCSIGFECNNTCNEAADNCYTTNGTGCADDGNVCTNDVCNGSGSCTHPNNTLPCDDTVACTQNDTCSGGTCNGTPNNGLCADNNVCTDDICTGGVGCSNPNNTASCTDDLYCNGADTCSGGTCSVHAGNPCSGGAECNDICNEAADNCYTTNGTGCTDDGNVCTNDVCNGSGSCTHPNNTLPCDDTVACTQNDTCSGGTCNGTPNNGLCADNNVCTDDICTGGVGCSNPNNTASCTDSLYCNGTDTCSGGSCSTHAGDPCPGPDGDGNCSESCNETADNCTAADLNGSVCTDSLYCNGTDTCSGGSCSTHAGDPCPGPDGDGNCSESCNETADNCTAADLNGSICTDSLYCNGTDTCSGGSCSSHAGNPCTGGSECNNTCNESADNCFTSNGTACTDDSNVCTNDVCNGSGSCTHPNNTASCTDGLYCNGTDTCSGGTCSVHSGDPCTGGAECNNTCNESGDNCYTSSGTSCTDDGNVCTNDLCNGSGSCDHPNNTASCDDSIYCNGTDTCSGGACSVHAGDPCSSGPVCNNTCNEAADNCYPPNGTACDDGLYCNGTDTCGVGSCSVHAGDPCSGGPECNNTCNEAADNCFTSNGTGCTDDGNFCTNDVCNGTGTCTHSNNTLPCDDTITCTEYDSCSEGTCSGTPNNGLCSDENVCTDDICTVGEGCSNPNNTLPCDDINLCTRDDVCVDGACAGTKIPGCVCGIEIARGRTCPGEEIDDPAYNRPGRRGLAATCGDVIDFTVCSDCDPFDQNCVVWDIDPNLAGSTITQLDDCCWRMDVGDICDGLEKIVTSVVTVTDTCEGGYDSVEIDIGKVIVDIGDTNMQPNSESGLVDLNLINPEHSIRAMVTDICECAGGEDNLVCTQCMVDSDRALDFSCSANEQPDGCCRIVLYSTDPSAIITQGRGTVAQIAYSAGPELDTCGEDACIDLCPVDSKVSDQYNEDLCVCESPGEVCFRTCGDIYPQDCIGGTCGAPNCCGDGIVDLFDILEAVDIILNLQTATACQIGNGDVPNGIPPYCGNPSGTPNCESDSDIDIFDVLVIIDKALGKMNCCDYCLFGEIF